jgi:hypothetical protein
MDNFKKLSRFDRLMAAITFAEAGEVKTAIEVMPEVRQKKKKRITKRPAKQADQRPTLRV